MEGISNRLMAGLWKFSDATQVVVVSTKKTQVLVVGVLLKCLFYGDNSKMVCCSGSCSPSCFFFQAHFAMGCGRNFIAKTKD